MDGSTKAYGDRPPGRLRAVSILGQRRVPSPGGDGALPPQPPPAKFSVCKLTASRRFLRQTTSSRFGVSWMRGRPAPRWSSRVHVRFGICHACICVLASSGKFFGSGNRGLRNRTAGQRAVLRVARRTRDERRCLRTWSIAYAHCRVSITNLARWVSKSKELRFWWASNHCVRT